MCIALPVAFGKRRHRFPEGVECGGKLLAEFAELRIAAADFVPQFALQAVHLHILLPHVRTDLIQLLPEMLILCLRGHLLLLHQRFDARTDLGNLLSALRTLLHAGPIGLNRFGVGIVDVSLTLTEPGLGIVVGHEAGHSRCKNQRDGQDEVRDNTT